jgi:hypothetical protein
MSRTLPRPRSVSPGKFVCETTAFIFGEATEFLPSVWEAGILAQGGKLSTSNRVNGKSKWLAKSPGRIVRTYPVFVTTSAFQSGHSFSVQRKSVQIKRDFIGVI